MTLTKEHIEILNHTHKRAAGGLYCGYSPEMAELVSAGLMEFAGQAAWCPDPYFRLTEAGRKAIAAPGDIKK